MIRFGSLGEFLAVASGPSNMDTAKRASRRLPASSKEEAFYGAVGFDQALTLSRAGDTAQAAKIQAQTMKTASDTFRIKTARFEPVYRDDGGLQVDVSRYLSGEPEFWQDVVPVVESPRVGLDVVLNVGGHSGIRAEQIESKAAEIAGAVLGLQAAGYLVNVYVAKHTSNGRRTAGTRQNMLFGFPLNVGGSPLNVALLTAVLQPYFFRRMIFSYYETLDAKTRRSFGIEIGKGYGCSVPMSENQARELSGASGRVVVVNVGESIMYRTDEVSKIRGSI